MYIPIVRVDSVLLFFFNRDAAELYNIYIYMMLYANVKYTYNIYIDTVWHIFRTLPVACLLLPHESKKEKSITLLLFLFYIYFFLYLYLRTRVHHCSGRVTCGQVGRYARVCTWYYVNSINESVLESNVHTTTVQCQFYFLHRFEEVISSNIYPHSVFRC